MDHNQLNKYQLSRRGAHNFPGRDVWGPREKSMGNPWSPTNASGTVILRLAENSLLHEEVADFLRSQMNVLPLEHLTYSTGPRGSRRLRRAAAAFLADEFHARQAITADNIFVTPGLASAIDAVAWATCDDGEGIMIPRPMYNGFNVDISNRSNARVVDVAYRGINEYSDLDDLFRPEINEVALEAALANAKKEGITVRALLISNPHNPLGRCYPPETLRVFSSFCGANGLHLISDEIYANSVFANSAIPNPTPFTSILSLGLENTIDPLFLHVLYGASKDFCANGLRIGFVYTQNQGLIGAMSSIGIFSWSPHVLQDVWAAMLEDKQWCHDFMRRKKDLMATRYELTTSFLSKHGIRFYEMNAGLYIWVDLRHLVAPRSSVGPPDNNDSIVTEPNLHGCKQCELRIAEICVKNGVMIAPGHVYSPEEFGWFRVTFTVRKDALEEGLKRLVVGLAEARLEFDKHSHE